MAEHEIDEEYWCEDIIILVEDRFFKVPRFAFDDSEVFREMFAMPQPGDAPRDGSSKESPLRLDSVSAVDFKSLLKHILPLSPSSAPLTLDELTSALKLCNMWGFKTACERAISTALALIPDPRERIVWAYKHEIKSWTVSALKELVLRRDPMSTGDLELMGPDMTLCIASVREIMASVHSDTSRRVGEGDEDHVDLEQVIQQEVELLECDRPFRSSWRELELWMTRPDPVVPMSWSSFVELLMEVGFDGVENVGCDLHKFTCGHFSIWDGLQSRVLYIMHRDEGNVSPQTVREYKTKLARIYHLDLT